MFLAGLPSSSLLAAPSLAFLFQTQAQREYPWKRKLGLSQVSQCASRVTTCQLAELGRTVRSSQNLRVASEPGQGWQRGAVERQECQEQDAHGADPWAAFNAITWIPFTLPGAMLEVS